MIRAGREVFVAPAPSSDGVHGRPRPVAGRAGRGGSVHRPHDHRSHDRDPESRKIMLQTESGVLEDLDRPARYCLAARRSASAASRESSPMAAARAAPPGSYDSPAEASCRIACTLRRRLPCISKLSQHVHVFRPRAHLDSEHMFASMPFRLPEALRRTGAHLKAFALLQDPSPAPAAPAADRARPGAARSQHPGSPSRHPASSSSGGVRHQAPAAASHAHRRPPRTRLDRGAARRPGSVPVRLQPCVMPVTAQRGGARDTTGLHMPATHERHPSR